ncbi:hypothetical protein HRI_000416200 [Hibiscus trionum]|uniref:Endonuclease/exonuclease/phosphatase domain-containing protein n=1 Tax=Hibiscus trionum TaxID=183268 RepID=A0A9W7GY09_HIBTR|nr:hypothetical protein HRI_000416200 [Hibiscus trionum]
MINILIWNIQGAASSSFRDQLRRIRASSKPSIVALLETRISGQRADSIVSRLGFQFSFRVEAQGFSGGIWLLWNSDVKVQALAISNQFIHVKLQGSMFLSPVFFTVVYASPHIQYRRFLWDRLESINPGNDHPWLLGGDFNAILHLDDRRGGQAHRHCVSKDFQRFVFTNALQEIDFKGPRFTWARGDLYERLDRCLANLAWLDSFPNSLVMHLDRIGSDHRPLLLCTEQIVPVLDDRPFRFLSAWQDFDDFIPLLQNSWSANLSLNENIKNLKGNLSQWHSRRFGDLGKRKKRIIARLRGIDRALGVRHSASLYELEKSLKAELDDILAVEESMWRQKARCYWVSDGDRNTKYYHAIANGRRKRNSILCLKDDSGTWVSNPETLKHLAVDFFTNLFTSDGSNGYSFNCRNCFHSLDQQDKVALDMAVSREEIRSALFQMNPSKAPGVDRFHASFYQRHWDVVGDVICHTI